MATRVLVDVAPGLAAAAPLRPSPTSQGTTALIRKAARAATGNADADLSVTLLSDGEIKALNKKHLGHDYVTDVISFPLYEEGETPVGDIYIGFAHVLKQAEAVGVPGREELARIVIHGTLHVLGHDHPADPEKMQRCPMWKLQEEILSEVRL